MLLKPAIKEKDEKNKKQGYCCSKKDRKAEEKKDHTQTERDNIQKAESCHNNI